MQDKQTATGLQLHNGKTTICNNIIIVHNGKTTLCTIIMYVIKSRQNVIVVSLHKYKVRSGGSKSYQFLNILATLQTVIVLIDKFSKEILYIWETAAGKVKKQF